MFKNYTDRLIAEEAWAEIEAEMTDEERAKVYAPPTEEELDYWDQAFDWIRARYEGTEEEEKENEIREIDWDEVAAEMALAEKELIKEVV